MADLIPFDSTRLQAALVNTGLQIKDNALYQVINQLILATAKMNKAGGTLIAPSSSSSKIVTPAIGIPGIDGIDGEDGFSVPGSRGADGVSGTSGSIGQPGLDGIDGENFMIPGPKGDDGPMVPYHIGINEVFRVPLYKQALFEMNIDNEGTIDVEGFLIEVD